MRWPSRNAATGRRSARPTTKPAGHSPPGSDPDPAGPDRFGHRPVGALSRADEAPSHPRPPAGPRRQKRQCRDLQHLRLRAPVPDQPKGVRRDRAPARAHHIAELAHRHRRRVCPRRMGPASNRRSVSLDCRCRRHASSRRRTAGVVRHRQRLPRTPRRPPRRRRGCWAGTLAWTEAVPHPAATACPATRTRGLRRRAWPRPCGRHPPAAAGRPPQRASPPVPPQRRARRPCGWPASTR
jgi:hypothetical protein